MQKNGLLIGVACVAAAAAIGGAYYLGRQGVGNTSSSVSESPQTIASADGAPRVPGLCVLSQNAVYTNAKVGQAATQRYRQLAAGLRAQLAPEQQAIQAAARKLESSKAGMPAAQFQQQEEALAPRVRALQAANAQDGRALEATRVKALRQIAAWANPIIGAAYKQRGCGALFSRDTMLVGNPGMDLTPIVIAGLDGRITSMTFDLEKVAAAPTQPIPQ